jgi:hypothetical protein
MAIIAFKNVQLLINDVDLSDRANSVVLTYEVEQQDATVMGGNRAFIGGIQNNTVEVTLYQDFAAGEVEATIFPLVGTTTSISLKPIKGEATSATNPGYSIVDAFLASHSPINATDVGATSPITLTFTGGTLTKSTS